jgi:hypothetical protein
VSSRSSTIIEIKLSSNTFLYTENNTMDHNENMKRSAESTEDDVESKEFSEKNKRRREGFSKRKGNR